MVDFIPKVIFMGFLLVVPVWVFTKSKFLVVKSFIITYIPELICCVTHVTDYVTVILIQFY